MMISRVVVAMAVVLMAVAVSTAYAGPGFGPGGCCGWGKAGPDLTNEQQKKADELRLQFLKKTEPLTAELSRKRLELAELASKDTPDEQAIEKKREEMWSLTDKIRNERREMGKKFRSLLTPEQRKKLGPYGFGRGWGGGRGKGWGPGALFGRGGGWGGGYGGAACPGCPYGS